MKCPDCGKEAKRHQIPPINSDGIQRDLPGKYWVCVYCDMYWREDEVEING